MYAFDACDNTVYIYIMCLSIISQIFNMIIRTITLFRSRIDPRPSIAIFVIVSSCNLFKELPFGPNNFPTKLNWKHTYMIYNTRTL